MKNNLKTHPYWYIKRLIDIVFSVVLIIITFPFLILTIIVIYLDLGLPIYNQKRYREGLYRNSFLMYKIRTKKMNSDSMPLMDRYTKVSRIIDRLHLNELPQLFNILKGDMSFIGPRPFIPEETLPNIKISDKRYLVRPGITGLAQVNGGRFLTHKQKLSYDEIYYDNFGFIQDIKILFKTPIDIIRQTNGYYVKKYYNK